jgi:tetratricopeptide (TPR) repeat protein
VRRIAEALRERGLKVWLDEWELVPGRRWLPALEKAIQTAGTVAVLVGESGMGPWEQPEYEGSLTEFVGRGLPVIPVLLPGAPAGIKLPLFLKGFTWVDLRNGLTEEGLDRLEWGITNKKPDREKKKPGLSGPKIHNLPFLPLGDLLKGRAEDLHALETTLHGPNSATAITQTQAIKGFGGIGKTRLAVEYAWRSAARFDSALFVVADSPEALRAGLAGLAQLGLPGMAAIPNRAQEEEQVAIVLAWLRTHDRWLLILDNVDTDDAAREVRTVLPRLGSGHVLITSRLRDWPSAIRRQSLDTLSVEEATQFLLQRTERAPTKMLEAAARDEVATGDLDKVLAWLQDNGNSVLVILDPEGTEDDRRSIAGLLPRLKGNVLITSLKKEKKLSPEKAQSFLRERTEAKRPREADDPLQASRLALLLDGLPLALELAAAYIDFHQTSFADYIAAWERELDQVFAWSDPSSMQYPASLAVTWQRSFKQLCPTAATILRLTANLAPDPVPLGIFETSVAIVQEAVNLFCLESSQVAESPAIREGLTELAAYSLVTRSDQAFTVHPMIQEVVGSQVPKGHRREWVEKSLHVINEASPRDAEDVRTWPVWDLLQPHARAVVATADRFEIADPTGRLMAHLGLLLKTKGLYSDAEPLMKRALEIDQGFFGPDHPNVANDLHNLAQLFQATNRLDEAEPLSRRALEIEENFLGADHPSVAIRLNNLVQLLQVANRFAEAEPLMRRALKIDEVAFGQRHPNVAIRLNSLAQLLQATNRLAEAEPLIRRALEIHEKEFGREHPAVATDLINLGVALQATNRVTEAEPLVRRALKIDEEAFGQDHPIVARDLNNLAQLLQSRNRLSESEPLMRRALKIDEGSFGQDHPNVARDLNNLAVLLQATNRRAESEPLIRRALKIDEDSFGQDHPNVARDLNNLARLLQATDRMAEAESLMRRALRIDEVSFGQDHPSIAIRLINLGLLFGATKRAAEAEPLIRRALKIDEESFGPDHPEVATDIFHLAWLLRATNRLAEAEPLMRRALRIFDASLGPDHPDTQNTVNKLKTIREELESRDSSASSAQPL